MKELQCLTGLGEVSAGTHWNEAELERKCLRAETLPQARRISPWPLFVRLDEILQLLKVFILLSSCCHVDVQPAEVELGMGICGCWN